MKHQITLVGGQLLPVFIGIREFMPDKIHFIISSESRAGAAQLKALLPGVPAKEYECNAYDFTFVKSTCEKILNQLPSGDEVCFNLTGGTKVMVLAVQAIIHERHIRGFYINQDNTLLELPTYTKKRIAYRVSTQEFLDISGHSNYTAKRLSDYTADDLKASRQIEAFADKGYQYFAVTGYFRDKYAKIPMPLSGKENINNSLICTWGANKVDIAQNCKNIASFQSQHITDLFFHAAWWELLVAQAISTWSKAKEVLIKFELPFKSDKSAMKNEIDILINLNNKLIFVECKSGNVKQEDINKMKVIKQTYGGLVSKSILVSRQLPRTTILEKCKELDIEVFYMYKIKGIVSNTFQKLIVQLDQLDKRTSL